MILSLEYVGMFEGADNYLHDLSFRVRGTVVANDNIIIVAIDEQTLEKLGRWPLNRRHYATLLDRTREARVVAFDIIMAEPTGDDIIFEEAMRGHGHVVLPAHLDDGLGFRNPAGTLASYRAGHVHVEQGVDGVVRKVFHRLKSGSASLPSFSLAILETVDGSAPATERPQASPSSGHPAVVQDEAMHINFYGPEGTFRTVSFADVIDGTYRSALFRGKIVFVGVTAAGLEDKVLTPFTQNRDRMSGVEVHATCLSNLLHQDFTRVLPDRLRLVTALFLSAGALFLFIRLDEKRAVALLMAGLATVTFLTFFLFSSPGIWANPSLLFASFSFMFLVAYIVRIERVGQLLFFARAEWEATFNDISDAIVVHDRDFTIIRANRAAVPFIEGAQSETWKARFRGFGGGYRDSADEKHLRQAKPASVEVFEPSLGRFLEITTIPRLDEHHRFAGMIHLIRDVTERIEAENQIRTHLERLRVLRTIDHAITSSLDLQVTLNVLLHEVVSHLHVDAAVVLLCGADGGSPEFAAGRSRNGTMMPERKEMTANGLSREVVRSMKPLVIPDLGGNAPASFRAARAGDFRAYFGMPLVVKSQLRGVLELYHRTPFDPDASWVDFLAALTGQAAIAIDNALMFKDLQLSREEIVKAYDATIEGWSRAMDVRDSDTEGHSRRVADMTVALGRAMSVPEDQLVHYRRGALLHDIGKLGVPDSILRKEGPLTDEERELMKAHPVISYEMLSPIAFLRPALDIPHCHHERWDGKGYPRGLKGCEIPLSARIFAVVDIWDAICSERPYSPAWSREQALAHIHSLSGSHLDASVVAVFLKMQDDDSRAPEHSARAAHDDIVHPAGIT